MTSAQEAVLRLFLENPESERYGLEVMTATQLPSGTVYPMLAKLEKEFNWLESREEHGDPRLMGRSARRFYRLTADGVIGSRAALHGVRRGVRRLLDTASDAFSVGPGRRQPSPSALSTAAAKFRAPAPDGANAARQEQLVSEAVAVLVEQGLAEKPTHPNRQTGTTAHPSIRITESPDVLGRDSFTSEDAYVAYILTINKVPDHLREKVGRQVRDSLALHDL